MRSFTCLCFVLCTSATVVLATKQPNPQLSTSEKQQVSKQGTQNPEAYALYLKGRSYWAKRTRADLETAVSYFNQAIAKDHGYAMAYAGLADCYAMLPDYGASVEDIPKAKAAALKAIELDPTLSRPHVNLGGMKMAHEWDLTGGEAEFKKALELDSNDSHAHQRYADNLGVLGGREQDALAEINRAHQLDPLSLAISVDVGNVYTYARRFDEAIVVCKKVASENPTFAGVHDCLANAYWGKKMYPQVIGEWKAYGKLTGERSDSDYAAALEQGFRSFQEHDIGLMGLNDDNQFLECVGAAQAHYLVTGNIRHFPEVWKETRIVTPREFINSLMPGRRFPTTWSNDTPLNRLFPVVPDFKLRSHIRREKYIHVSRDQ